MTSEQLLFTVSKIHSWNQEPEEIVARAFQLVLLSEKAAAINTEAEELKAQGMSPHEAMLEQIRRRYGNQ